MTRVAIHQPNVLPWLGFFAKAMQADVLVLLDDVPFSRGSYTNRVKVMGPNGPEWLTVPVAHPCSGVAIREVRVAGGRAGWEAAGARLASWYGAYPHHHVVLSAADYERLAPPNVDWIAWTLRALGIRPRIVIASDVRAKPEPGSAGLAQLCRAAGATTYIAGNGAPYDDLSVYEAAGISCERARFTHPEYPQRRPEGTAFVPGLSIVDALCNVGVEETRRLLVESIR